MCCWSMNAVDRQLNSDNSIAVCMKRAMHLPSHSCLFLCRRCSGRPWSIGRHSAHSTATTPRTKAAAVPPATSVPWRRFPAGRSQSTDRCSCAASSSAACHCSCSPEPLALPGHCTSTRGGASSVMTGTDSAVCHQLSACCTCCLCCGWGYRACSGTVSSVPAGQLGVACSWGRTPGEACSGGGRRQG